MTNLTMHCIQAAIVVQLEHHHSSYRWMNAVVRRFWPFGSRAVGARDLMRVA